MKAKRMILLVVLCAGCILGACDRVPVFTLATHQNNTQPAEVGEYLAEVLSQQHGWKLEVLAGKPYNAEANIDLVAEGKVDFGITTNAIQLERALGVRTVLPLYPEIIVVLYNESVGAPKSLEELLSKKRVGVGPKELRHSQLMLDLIRGFGIDLGIFHPVYTPLAEMDVLGDQMDVLFTFAGTDLARIERQLINGAKLFSFDDYTLRGKGSTVDGFLLRHPNFQSFIIPKNTFDRLPETPILTLAAEMLLISSQDADESEVYDLVSTVFDNASYLSQQNPVLGFLSFDFDEAKLSFPLHEGTRQYLNRDQPSFLERYAEVFALVFSVIVVVFGLLSSASRVLKKRKKDRIDVYYEKILHLEQRSFPNEQAIRQALGELSELKIRALRQLQHEKLQADESFTIFLDLVHQTRLDLEKKLEILQGSRLGHEQ